MMMVYKTCVQFFFASDLTTLPLFCTCIILACILLTAAAENNESQWDKDEKSAINNVVTRLPQKRKSTFVEIFLHSSGTSGPHLSKKL